MQAIIPTEYRILLHAFFMLYHTSHNVCAMIL